MSEVSLEPEHGTSLQHITGPAQTQSIYTPLELSRHVWTARNTSPVQRFTEYFFCITKYFWTVLHLHDDMT